MLTRLNRKKANNPRRTPPRYDAADGRLSLTLDRQPLSASCSGSAPAGALSRRCGTGSRPTRRLRLDAPRLTRASSGRDRSGTRSTTGVNPSDRTPSRSPNSAAPHLIDISRPRGSTRSWRGRQAGGKPPTEWTGPR